MPELIALVLVCLLAGVALGWHLRKVNPWCPQCGDRLACAGCGRQVPWPVSRRARRVTH